MTSGKNFNLKIKENQHLNFHRFPNSNNRWEKMSNLALE
jgi:hypothetical protein